jgi:hypothetical protein
LNRQQAIAVREKWSMGDSVFEGSNRGSGSEWARGARR